MKVKFALKQAMKAQREVDVQLYSFASAVGGGRRSSPRLGHFTPGKDSVSIVQEAG